MTPGTLSPAYVVLNYHSAYGTHKATLGTKEWFPTSLTGHLGSYENWNGLPCDAEEMIQAYADAMMAYYKNTAAIDNAEIWTKATPTDPAYPRVNYPITSVGTSSAATWDKATQQQWLIRGTDFSLWKSVFLDSVAPTDWNALADLTGLTEAIAFVGAITSDNWAWQTRKDAQPFNFVKVTYKLNDKLRHEYDMD
jgi:hypothetical protein